MIEHLNRTKEVWMYDFLCLWRKGGMASYAQDQQDNKFDYLYVGKAGGKELSHDNTAIHNIARVFDWDWITQSPQVTGPDWTTQEIQELPDDWDEVYVCYRNYPQAFRKLIARNNHDGTVQLYKV